MSSALHRKLASGIVARHHAHPEQQEERLKAIAGLAALQEIAAAAAASNAAGSASNSDLALLPPAASSSSSISGSLALHRSFRLLVQSRSVSVYRSLLTEFGSVAEEMKELQHSLDESAHLAQALADQLKTMKQRSNALFQTSASLSGQQAALAGKRQLVETFLTQFQLDAQDARVLDEAREEALGEEFFRALEKIAEKKKNIEAMLAGAAATGAAGVPSTPAVEWSAQVASPSTSVGSLGGSNRISLDLLDSLSKQLEVAYEKLYRHIQSSLQGQRVVKTGDLTPKFVRSFDLLRNVPVYFDHCLGDLISARRSLLIERFLKALSRGSAGARPIELSAHDPVRYCSDMLAWIHQALANEKEFLMTLFPVGGVKTEANSPNPAESQARDYQTYLSSIFEALSRPLRVRIEQCFTNVSGSGSSGPSATAAPTQATHAQIETVFKIWNILRFYRVIIEPILPEQTAPAGVGSANGLSSAMAHGASADLSPLSSGSSSSSDLLSTLGLLSAHARASFFALLQLAGTRVARPVAPLPADLAPPPVVSEWLSQLAQLMSIYNSALVAPQEKEREFEEILLAVMEPLLTGIGLGAHDQATATADVDTLIYRLNVLHAVLTVCATFPTFVARRVETLNFLVDQQVAQLVDQQAKTVWRQAEMERMMVTAATAGSNGITNLRATPEMNIGALTAGVQRFYSSLLSVGAFIVPQCDRLLPTAIRRHCRSSIARRLSDQYRQLYAVVTAPNNGFEPTEVQAIFLHSPAHVDLLLDLQSGPPTPVNK